MPQDEVSLVAGAGNQSGSIRRGNYASMNVDPSDGCTIWFTGEYGDGSGWWGTGVGAFKFSSCPSAGGCSATGNDLAVDFGPAYGLYVYYNEATWTKRHPRSPDSRVLGELNCK